MSLSVRQLNADSTFLLTFTPPFAPSNTKDRFPGTFNILVDPWLNGASIVAHPRFATNKHSKPVAITSLTELDEEIDLIVISQDKSDHLHKETLCSLPRDSKIRIAATPKAEKEIRRWQHFKNTDILQVLEPYNPKKPDTVLRIPIDPYSSASAEGEVTISNIVQERDITHLHNAIAITYCPPGTILTSPTGSTVKLTDMPMMSSSKPGSATTSITSTPPSSPPRKKRYVCGSLDTVDFVRPSAVRKPSSDYDATIPPEPRQDRDQSPRGRPSTSGSRPPTSHLFEKRRDNFEKVLSVVYTPHGVSRSTLQPYVKNHLSTLKGALPTTALIHSLNVESNPWWMGGLISGGAPGGIKLIEDLDARYWIGAHDEIKDSSGLAITWLSKTKYTAEEATKLLREKEGMGMGKGMGTQVIAMDCGEQRRLVV